MIKTPVYWPNKVLSSKTEKIIEFDTGLAGLAQDLHDTMNFLGGVGMAATQIGVNKDIFVISTSILEDDNLPLLQSCRVFVNARIIWTSEETSKDLEGCLSFPDIFLKIERPKSIKVLSQDLSGNLFEMEATDFLARAIQHEQDHCSGKVMTDFVSGLKRDMVRKKLSKWKKRYSERKS